LNRHFTATLIDRCRILTMGALVGLLLASASFTTDAHTTDQPMEISSTPLPATAVPAKAAGCGQTGHHATGEFTWSTIDGNRRTRTFLVQVPADYQSTSTKSYPLVFVFHGAGGSSAQSYSWGLQNVSGASENGIFVFPEGIAYQNYGIGWDDTRNGYDIPFFDNMVKDIEAYYCVDTTRVFVAGFSWGGDFVTSLVCNRSSVIRAAAANSTTDEYNTASNYATYQNGPCSKATPPAVRFEHAVGGDSAYPAPLFSTTSKLFQYVNSCSATSTAVSKTSVESCGSYNSCSKEYLECSFNASIGHTLPPGWAANVWAFFSTFKTG
jgi:poly(3-hydroxybutyrate) depolymerase